MATAATPQFARELRKLLKAIEDLEVSPETSRDPNQALPRPLTPREISVLTAVASGLSNPEVAQQLYISPATVKTHMGRIKHKLRARDRTHAAVIAAARGIIVPEDQA